MHRKGGTDDGLAAAFFCTASTTASGVRIVELSEDCAKSERDIADRSAQDGRVGAVIMGSQRQWCRTERGAILRCMRSNDGRWSAPWRQETERAGSALVPAPGRARTSRSRPQCASRSAGGFPRSPKIAVRHTMRRCGQSTRPHRDSSQSALSSVLQVGRRVQRAGGSGDVQDRVRAGV